MAIKRKSGAQGGGSWVAVDPGKLRHGWGWGGMHWVDSGIVYRKMGDVGGGYWYNTGYYGYPSVPNNFAFKSGNVTSTNLAWQPGTGGADVWYYHCQMMNEFFGLIQEKTTTSQGVSFTFAQGPEGTRYQYRLRAFSLGSLPGPWSPYVRLGYSVNGIYGW